MTRRIHSPFSCFFGRSDSPKGWHERAPGMGNRQEVTDARRKSRPGALTKGTRHRRDKGTVLEHQGTGGGAAPQDPRGRVWWKS